MTNQTAHNANLAGQLPQDVQEFLAEIGERHLESCCLDTEDCPYCQTYHKYVPWEATPNGRLAGAKPSAADLGEIGANE